MMKFAHKLTRHATRGGLVGGVMLAAVAVIAGQTPKAPSAPAKPAAAQAKPAAAWPVMRKDGQPDMEGVWEPDWGCNDRGGCGPGTVGMNIEELKNLFGSRATSASMVIDPPDKKIPYLPWARARRDEVADHHLAPNPAQVDTRTRGWPDGVPRLNTYHQLEFRQQPGAVLILYEVQHEFRYIPLDNRPQLDPGVNLWMGSSRGHWEGTTFVVDVRNLSDQIRMDVIGDFFSDGVKITEHWKFLDAENLMYQATVEDPKVYSRPWTYEQKLKRFPNKDYEAFEYAGVEGTKDPDLIESLQKGK
jgi:hypothetical protein